jgi:hypothetical protein
MSADIKPFENLTAKKLQSLGKKLDKTIDAAGYKHQDILRDAADDSEGLLWHLVREDLVLNQLKSMGLVDALTSSIEYECEGVCFDDILKVLKRLPDNMAELDKECSDWTYTPGVPSGVDALVTQAHILDPEGLKAARADLSPNLQVAIEFVRGRFGETISSESSETILRHLAETHCEEGLDCNWDLKVSASESVALADTDAVRKLALRFGDLSTWATTQKDWLRTHVQTFSEYGGIPSRAIDGMRLLSLADLVYLFAKADTDYREALPILDAREDSPSALIEAAQLLTEKGKAAFKIDAEQAPVKRDEYEEDYGDDDYGDEEDYGDDDYGDEDDYGDDDYDDDDYDEDEEVESSDLKLSELLAVVAVNRAHRAGEEAPASVDALLNLEGVYASEREFIPRLREALASMGPERCHEIVRRAASNEYYYGRALSIADVFFDDALMAEVLDRCDAGNYGIDSEFLVNGKLQLVPLIAARAEQSSKPENALKYREGNLLLLSTASARGEKWDEAWDKEIRLDAVNFSYGGSRVEPVLAMLRALPVERTEAILRENLRHCAKEPWRLVRCLRSEVSESLLEDIFSAAVAEEKSVENGSFGYEALRELGARAVGPWRKALKGASLGSRFTSELGRVMGEHADAILKDGDTKVESKMEEFARLLSEASGPTVRVYTLERDDTQPEESTIARIGGSPIGVAERAVPQFDDEAMTHIFTLDLADFPEIASRFDGARALSLYLPDPGYAEHHHSGELVPVQEANLQDSPGDIEGAASIAIQAYDVPMAAFDAEVDGDLKRVREILYSQSAYALGGPLWLQDGEPGADPDFLLQFDESFADINLGDAGIMYLFDGDIDWQCH